MLAIVGAFLAALSAFGVHTDDVDLFQLGIAFFFLHFGVTVGAPIVLGRRRRSE